MAFLIAYSGFRNDYLTIVSIWVLFMRTSLGPVVAEGVLW